MHSNLSLCFDVEGMKKPSFLLKRRLCLRRRKQTLLIFQSMICSAGISTSIVLLTGKLVAGHHRASPSASLDKKFAIQFVDPNTNGNIE
jgi:hypothetical protein